MLTLALALMALQDQEVKDKEFHYSLKLPPSWSSTTDIPENMKATIEQMIGTTKARLVRHEKSRTVLIVGARSHEQNPIQTFSDFKNFCRTVTDNVPLHYPGAKVTAQGPKRFGKIQGYAFRFFLKVQGKGASHIDDVRMLYTTTHIYFLQAVWPLETEAPAELERIMESFSLDVDSSRLELKKASKDLGPAVNVPAFEFSIQVPRMWIRDTGGEKTALRFKSQGCTIEVESVETESSLRDVVAAWKGDLQKSGAAKKFTDGQDIAIDGLSAHQVGYTLEEGKSSSRVLRTTVCTGSRAYHLIFSAPEDEYEFWDDCFKAVAESFKRAHK